MRGELYAEPLWASDGQARWALAVGTGALHLIASRDHNNKVSMWPPMCKCGRTGWRPGRATTLFSLCGTCELPYGWSAVGTVVTDADAVGFIEACCELMGLDPLEAALLAPQIQILARELEQAHQATAAKPLGSI